MSKPKTRRYCADPAAIAAMKRDGMGWGHDLECGCFEDTALVPRPNLFTRLANQFKRRS